MSTEWAFPKTLGPVTFPSITYKLWCLVCRPPWPVPRALLMHWCTDYQSWVRPRLLVCIGSLLVHYLRESEVNIFITSLLSHIFQVQVFITIPMLPALPTVSQVMILAVLLAIWSEPTTLDLAGAKDCMTDGGTGRGMLKLLRWYELLRGVGL